MQAHLNTQWEFTLVEISEIKGVLAALALAKYGLLAKINKSQGVPT